MQNKTIEKMNALVFTTQTNMAGLQQYVRVKAHELHQLAAKNNLEVTGPVYWIYTGVDGNPETRFQLEIALPVSQPNGEFEDCAIKKLSVFHCLSETYNGDWNGIPGVYQQLFSEAMTQKLMPMGVSREIYIHMDFEHPENNITEVQLGIQPKNM
jgi:effector-binding domain-containing protein